MNSSLKPLQAFFFQEIPSYGFQRMQRVWAGVSLAFLLLTWQDMGLFYGEAGFFLSILLAASLVCVLLSFQTRAALIISVLMLLSLQRINSLPMGGGDLLLFNTGFLLMITPGLNAPTMPIWPYRLLLWQLIVLYVSSAWQKLLGTMWIDGSAVSIALQHPHFARWDLPLSLVESVSPFLSYGTVVWELLWLALLIPAWKYHERLKIFLLITGVLFHVGVFLLFKVGSLSFAVLVTYVGVAKNRLHQH